MDLSWLTTSHNRNQKHWPRRTDQLAPQPFPISASTKTSRPTSTVASKTRNSPSTPSVYLLVFSPISAPFFSHSSLNCLKPLGKSSPSRSLILLPTKLQSDVAIPLQKTCLLTCRSSRSRLSVHGPTRFMRNGSVPILKRFCGSSPETKSGFPK